MVFTDSTVGSSSAGAAHHDSDDISLILRHLLYRSSSSPPLASSSSTALMLPSTFPPMGSHAGDQQHLPCFSIPGTGTLNRQIPGRSAVFSGSDRLVVDRISDDTLSGVVLCSSNLSSESLTGSVQMTGLDQEFADEGDFDSEEGAEAAEEEGETKQRRPQRNQSKRSRAAEVHNLSEKRRRSRINEKMKALQNLIPNSNKTDKASMLDEAIEYLKQLQLQVQMLSMRNGLSLHPMCLPGVPGILHPSQLSQMGLDLGHDGGSLDINTTNALDMTMTTSDTIFNLPKQSASTARPSLPSVSTVINSEAASFGLESCIPANFSPFELRDSPEVVCREKSVLQDHFVMNNNETKSLVTTVPLLFDTRESNAKGHSSFEGCNKQKYGQQEMLLENVSVKNQPTSSDFISGYH